MVDDDLYPAWVRESPDLVSLIEESPYRFEWEDGQLIVNAQPKLGHNLTVNQIAIWLSNFVPVNAVVPGVALRITADDDPELYSEYVPDIVVLASPDELDRERHWFDPSVAVLVVEVLSPNTRTRDRGAKRDAYHEAGLAYWIVDWQRQTIERFDDDELGWDADALAEHLWSD